MIWTENWCGHSSQDRSDFVEHVLQKESLENIVLKGKVEGQRARGRQRLTFRGWLERANSGIQPLHNNLIRRLKHRGDTDVMTAGYIRILARHTDWLIDIEIDALSRTLTKSRFINICGASLSHQSSSDVVGRMHSVYSWRHQPSQQQQSSSFIRHPANHAIIIMMEQTTDLWAKTVPRIINSHVDRQQETNKMPCYRREDRAMPIMPL